MAESVSPLRYPGGKQVLARVLGHLIRLNGREGGVYVEAYAGGAGAALALLFGEHVERIAINDADSRIHAFWESILNRTDQFLRLLNDTPLSVEEWKRQRDVYLTADRRSGLKVGFATFYLNRCNRSGIIANGGLIGGLAQTGKWKIDARFNRTTLSRRVERIASYRDRIDVYNFDAETFLKEEMAKPTRVDRGFAYLDPPYFGKGSQLYLNHYLAEDHVKLSQYLADSNFIWVMTYDNAKEIRDLYKNCRQTAFDLGYSARDSRIGKEILVMPACLRFPTAWVERIPSTFITAADRIQVPLPIDVD